MACELKSCTFYLFLSFLSVFVIYIVLYIALYIYIAYITYYYNSSDIIQWRETELNNIEQKYAQMPLQ